ncbi:MAG: triple tyrosine motif-containing protein [Bacteroidota bacterium]
MGDLLDSTQAIVRLTEAENGDIWYVTDQETGILRLSDIGVKKTWQKFILPGLRTRLVGGFELMYPYDSPRAFVGIEQGFLHFDTLDYEIGPPFPVRIQQVQLLSDHARLLYGGYGDADQLEMPRLNPGENNFRFTFSLPTFKELEQVKYQYYLEGVEDRWSLPTTKPDKEYTTLSPGKYSFHVRGINAAGVPSQETIYTFEIMAPWYQQPLALAFYLCVLGGIVIGLIYFPRAKYEREKAHLQSVQAQREVVHQAQIAETQEALIQLENEKLEAEIQHKNKDLAATTMHLVQKGELIQKLRLELEQIEQDSDEIKTRKSIRRLIHLLQHDKQVDKDWERFTQHFDQVHRDFLSRLHKDFPALTPKDQKLCAYLKMNLSTKEIAPLMNISVRGVEISRYRLRKKLNLPREANLNEFMMNYAEEVLQS